jgi:hypothetical protein
MKPATFSSAVRLVRWRLGRRFRSRCAGGFQRSFPILPTLAPTSTDTTTDYYDVTMQVGQRNHSRAIDDDLGLQHLSGPTIVARRIGALSSATE